MENHIDSQFYLEIIEPNIKKVTQDAKEEILREIQAIYHCNESFLKDKFQRELFFYKTILTIQIIISLLWIICL